ncbi:ABC-2 family transporter protein [Paenibacillus sp. N1-5-1-14]|uniref:ABC transporter permease n=1 Tax=Paenibacillus radicibacter TaxID=2972488 RepID=UPI002158F3FB|nr:ABC-2 family transporter protein [Paenibacillus radicibacter]MCR8642483.1 ABC-2 family transporter protein [Paenibacillus radicibacter]
MKMLKMYGLLIRASLRSQMQYKMNFFISTVLAAFVSASEFLMIALVLMKFGSIKGWSIAEVAYLYGVIMMSKAIYRSLASDVHHLEKYLVTGNFDSLLLRPIPVLLALMSQNFKILFAEFGQSLLVLYFAMRTMMHSGQIDWTAIPLTIITVLSGSIILFAIGLATATVGFWTTRVDELQTMTEDAARTAAQYPLELYPKWFKGILLMLIPVGLTNYVPALAILRNEYGLWVIGVIPIAAIAFFAISFAFWRFGITKYQSTGT